MVSEPRTLLLHILARAHAKRNMGYGGLKNLAQRAANRTDGDIDEAFRLIKAFLDSGTPLRGTNENALVAELRAEFADINGNGNGGPSFGEVLEAILSDEPALDRDTLVGFFTPFEGTDLVAKNLRSQSIEGLFDQKSADFAQLDTAKHISQVYALAALMFDRSSDDVTPIDSRFSEKRHFSFIRRSTGRLDSLVIHGLKFEPHTERQGYTYFSEKYDRHDDDGQSLGSREANGVSFFDQNFVYGLARSAHRNSLSYFVGRRPGVDDFFWFDAMLTTSNTAGDRISARGICIWHELEEQKRALTGVRPASDVAAFFSDDRRRAVLDAWLKAPERQMTMAL